jgi:hypothetical protein
MYVHCGLDSSVLRKVKWELLPKPVRPGFIKSGALDIQWLAFNQGALNII